MAVILAEGKQQYFDAAGDPLAGGQLWTYAAGTSTPLATYSDSAGTVPNTNPVTLDARGEAVVYWGAAPYKVILKDAGGATIWTVDNVASGLGDLASTATGKGAALVGTQGGGTVQQYITGTTNLAQWSGYDGSGATEITTTIQAALNSGAKRVVIPPGTHLTGTVTVPAGVELCGLGPASILKAKNSLNAMVVSVAGAGNYLHDFDIDGNGDNQNTAVGTNGGLSQGIKLLTTSSKCRLERINVSKVCDWGFGIYGSGHRVYACTAANNRAITTFSAVRAGFLVGDTSNAVSDIQVIGCSSTDHTASNYLDGFIFENGTDVTVAYCRAYNVTWTGIKPKADRMKVIGCHAELCRSNGFQTQGGLNNAQIIGNTSHNNGNAGFLFVSSEVGTFKNWVVHGNIATNNGWDTASGEATSRYGIAFAMSASCFLDGLSFVGNQATDTTTFQQRGFSFDGTASAILRANISGNIANGHTSPAIDAFGPVGGALDYTTIMLGKNQCKQGSSSRALAREGRVVEYQFNAENIAAAAGTTFLNGAGGASGGLTLPANGYFRRVWVGLANGQAVTAGTCTTTVRLNSGSAISGLSLTLTTANPSSNSVDVDQFASTFTQGQRLSVTYSTDAGFLPTGSVDLAIVVECVLF